MLSVPLDSKRKCVAATEEDKNGCHPAPEEVKVSLGDICKGDLYFIGILWIAALKTVLLGPIPTVEAAAPDKKDEKNSQNAPPKMRYKDLPLYETPYYAFHEKAAKKHVCPEANHKMLHEYLLPMVSKIRANIMEQFEVTTQGVCKMSNDISTTVDTKAQDFMFCMRCEGNYKVRYGILSLSTLLGFKVGGGGGGIAKRIFFTGLGALFGGALCFPEETDNVFKSIAYHVANTGVAFYNTFCGKNVSLPTKVPCHQDHPHK